MSAEVSSVILLLAGVFAIGGVVGYWLGYDHGRDAGYDKGKLAVLDGQYRVVEITRYVKDDSAEKEGGDDD